MMQLLRRIRRIGRIAEAAPPRSGTGAAGRHPPGGSHQEAAEARAAMAGSVQVRHVDAGSCNGCEIEIGSAFGAVYDAERYGARLVASPRHADALLVTGPVTRNMAEPLRRTYNAVPAPKLVVAVGDCARDCGAFAGAYAVVGAVREVVPVTIEVAGCPPRPEAIVAALRELTGR